VVEVVEVVDVVELVVDAVVGGSVVGGAVVVGGSVESVEATATAVEELVSAAEAAVLKCSPRYTATSARATIQRVAAPTMSQRRPLRPLFDLSAPVMSVSIIAEPP